MFKDQILPIKLQTVQKIKILKYYILKNTETFFLLFWLFQNLIFLP